jgi:hypothetical protein
VTGNMANLISAFSARSRRGFPRPVYVPGTVTRCLVVDI